VTARTTMPPQQTVPPSGASAGDDGDCDRRKHSADPGSDWISTWSLYLVCGVMSALKKAAIVQKAHSLRMRIPSGWVDGVADGDGDGETWRRLSG
jgi:hypothetical protein